MGRVRGLVRRPRRLGRHRRAARRPAIWRLRRAGATCRCSWTRSPRPCSSPRRSAASATTSTRSCSAGRPACRGGSRSRRPTGRPGTPSTQHVPADVPVRADLRLAARGGAGRGWGITGIRPPGLFALYVTGYSAFRIFEETLRIDSSAAFPRPAAELLRRLPADHHRHRLVHPQPARRAAGRRTRPRPSPRRPAPPSRSRPVRPAAARRESSRPRPGGRAPWVRHERQRGSGRRRRDDPAAGRPRVGPDIALLRRSREFRLLYGGQMSAFAGVMISYVAMPYQAYQLTHSSLVVGLLSLAELVPLIGTALLGGALADAVDRRRLIWSASAPRAAHGAALALNAAAWHQLWLLFLLAVAVTGRSALQRPSLEALVPGWSPRGPGRRGGAVRAARHHRQHGRAADRRWPVVGGLPLAYAVDGATCAAAAVPFARMRPSPPPPDADRPSLRGMAEGLRYAEAGLTSRHLPDRHRGDAVRRPYALFPQIAARLGGPAVLGLLYAAPGGLDGRQHDQRLGQPGAPARPGHRACRLRLGRRASPRSGSRRACRSRSSRWPRRAPPT